jgi:hypothetical protein
MSEDALQRTSKELTDLSKAIGGQSIYLRVIIVTRLPGGTDS